MNKIRLQVILLFCANLLVNCNDTAKDENRPKEEVNFSFDLHNLKLSENYNLSHRKKEYLSIGAMVPVQNKRMTKLLCNGEIILKFNPDEKVNLVTFIPRLMPTMCSVTYVKGSTVCVKRFCKSDNWVQVTNEDYKLQALEMAKKKPEMIFDLSNIEFDKIHLDEETKGDLTFYSFSPKKNVTIKTIADGVNVIWHSNDETHVIDGFFSIQTQPKLLSFMIKNKGFVDLKFFSAHEDIYSEISIAEYTFTLKNFAYSTREDLTLNLDSQEYSTFKISSSIVDGVSFIDSFLKDPSKKVERVVAKEHTLWYRDENETFIKASYTISPDPRLYKLVLCATRGSAKIYHNLYFIYKSGIMFKLPEKDYKKELKKVVYPRESFEEFDIKTLAEKKATQPYTSIAYFPPEDKGLKIVKYENQQIWVSTGKDIVKSVFYFRNEEKHMVQLSCRDGENVTRTHHFQDSNSYFNIKSDDKSWLWISTPEFYKSIGLRQVIKTHTYLDIGLRADTGAYEHKFGRVGNVMVQTFVPYSSFEVSSVLDCNREMWKNELRERLAALALYGDHKEFERKSKEETKNQGEDSTDVNPFRNSLSKSFRLAEIFIKGPKKVERQFLELKNNDWVKIKEEEFVKIYKTLETPDG
ncbi:uncharacterized protein TA14945 [Theileria annulata]|uniref:Lipoprotein n=1 Tax=Theileria annulata TaxID=5874 RepID=Q4UFB1_THEAN|nr:uncharacterized protein TA14945 [Theileria annulata]CAI74228.1 hypothetical protein TA14945 [Theileria annulata]|eukprot:XP_951960.1 hypothetical protein TA14945 [Theileria annulata]